MENWYYFRRLHNLEVSERKKKKKEKKQSKILYLFGENCKGSIGDNWVHFLDQR